MCPAVPLLWYMTFLLVANLLPRHVLCGPTCLLQHLWVAQQPARLMLPLNMTWSCLCPAGWLNLLGQIASVSATSFLCSGLINTTIGMAYAMNQQEYTPFTQAQVRQRQELTSRAIPAGCRSCAGSGLSDMCLGQGYQPHSSLLGSGPILCSVLS